MRSATLFVLSMLPLAAQWDDYRDKNVPLGRDGKPNLSAPAPKAANGKPSLSGVWVYPAPFEEGDQTSNADPTKIPFLNIAAPLPPGALPMKPAAAALFGERARGMGKDAPLARCLPPGTPWSYLIPAPFKIVQTPELIVILHEEGNDYRQIFLDGRKLPKDPVPTWNGYAIGRWEGDTLVVESTGYNDKAWLDGMGHPRSESARMTERFRRLDAGHLEIEITMNDPGAYERPWTSKVGFVLNPMQDVIEKVCLENEKDVGHLVGN
jgi:hypothetical protein